MNFSDCNGCDSLSVLAVQAEIGGMVTPNLAILFDWTGDFHPYSDGGTLSSNLFDAAIRYYFARILWIEGGLGFGFLSFTDQDGFTDETDWGLGLMGAFGVEVLQTYNFALDLSVRLSGERVSRNPDVSVGSVAFLVGFHWY